MIDEILKLWFALEGDAQDAVRALGVGVNYFPNAAASTVVDPYITWQLIGQRKPQGLKGLSGLSRQSVHITAHSRSKLKAASIAAAIVGTQAAPGLVGYQGTLTLENSSTVKVTGVHFLDCTDLYGDPKVAESIGWFGSQLHVALWHQDPIPAA